MIFLMPAMVWWNLQPMVDGCETNVQPHPMKDVLEAVLTDPSVRSAESLEPLAARQAAFLTWS